MGRKTHWAGGHSRAKEEGASLASLISGLLLLSSSHLVLADCECGYRVNVNTTGANSTITTTSTSAQYVLTDLIETNFVNISDISKNTDWVRQAFNVSATLARGAYGQMTAVENVNSTEGDGLEITVRSGTTEGMVQGGEIDTARLDVFYGTFRSSMRLTDVSGTVSAFFWVSKSQREGGGGHYHDLVPSWGPNLLGTSLNYYLVESHEYE